MLEGWLKLVGELDKMKHIFKSTKAAGLRMRVVLQVHESASRQFADWRRYLIQSPTGGRAIADLHWDELKKEMITKLGVPDGAEQGDDGGWVWDYSSDVTFKYFVRDQIQGILRRRVRTVVITEIKIRGSRL